MTEAVVVEVRYPLLDDRMVAFANRLPVDYKVRGTLQGRAARPIAAKDHQQGQARLRPALRAVPEKRRRAPRDRPRQPFVVQASRIRAAGPRRSTAPVASGQPCQLLRCNDMGSDDVGDVAAHPRAVAGSTGAVANKVRRPPTRLDSARPAQATCRRHPRPQALAFSLAATIPRPNRLLASYSCWRFHRRTFIIYRRQRRS